jgi:hypothetical protein
MRAANIWVVTLIAGIVGIGTAQAQSGVTTAPRAVRQCLCAQRDVSVLGHEMRQSRRHNEQVHRDVAALSHQVEDARARVNTDNRGDIDAFRALLQRRDEAAGASAQDDARYADAVARYNAAVERNNAACVGRLFDPEEVEAVKANLVCPRP